MWVYESEESVCLPAVRGSLCEVDGAMHELQCLEFFSGTSGGDGDDWKVGFRKG